MLRHRPAVWVALALPLLLTFACAPASTGRGGGVSQQDAAQQAARPRGSITMAVAWEPDQLGAKGTGGESGSEPRWIFNSTLTYYDRQGNVHPLLAERVPSRDNGDWVINADGTMVTTYRLRPNIRWHDGVPLTARDFNFAHQVYLDPGLPFRSDVEKRMSAVDALDDLTVRISWSEPYALANQVGAQDLPPLPRHKMEERYRTDKANFFSADDWTTNYVGAGPFHLDRWDAGVRIVARAFDDWFLGPPKLETIEIRFIGDPSAVLANLLAGEIDFTGSPPLRINEAIIARDQWAAGGAGYIKTWEQRIRYLEYQYREVPNWQRIVLDPNVRRALMQAIDRQQVAEVMTSGLGRLADVWALPADPVYDEADRVIAKYPYDPQRALGILAEAGWTRGASGLLTNAAGQTLDVDVNSGSAEAQLPPIIGDAWKTIGVNAGLDMVPTAQLNDPVARSRYTGARIGQRGPTMDGFHFLTSKIPQPPRFNDANYGSFSDPEVDRLQGIAVTSFDEGERRQAAVGVSKRLMEISAYTPLYYQSDVLVAKNRLAGPVGPGLNQPGVTFNIYEWEVNEAR